MAIRRAARKAERYEFDRAVDARGLKRSVFVALVGLGAAGGSCPPPRTRPGRRSDASPCRSAGPRRRRRRRSRVLAPKPLPHRMAPGEPLDLKLALRGLVPDRVMVSVKLDGPPALEQAYAVVPSESAPDAADLTVRIEPTRIPRDFQFRVRANDADTGWQSVRCCRRRSSSRSTAGRRRTPRSTSPAYTDLPPTELPDGSGVIECVVGAK